MVGRVWGRRGVKVYQPRLQLAYYWRYLFLVINAQAGQLHWCWLDSMAGEQMVTAVGGLKNHTEVATVVWDGAPGHQHQWAREWGMPLIGLPPYSPKLNPDSIGAERVFNEVLRAIEGKVYEPVPKFKLGLSASFDWLRTNGFVPFVVSLSNH
jgi:hypothetical protein